MRDVTEQDFRKKEFRDAKVEDYEFRDDGALVRKDRWMRGVQDIACILFGGRSFEIAEVVERVRQLMPPDYEGEDLGIECTIAALNEKGKTCDH